MRAVRRCGLTHGMRSTRFSIRQLRRQFGNPPQNRPELLVPLMSTVISEAIFVQICLQILVRNRMIHAPNTILHKRPESLDCIGVNMAAHVIPTLVSDAIVPVEPLPIRIAQKVDALVTRVLIGIDQAFRNAVLCDDRTQFVGSDARNDFRNNFLSAFSLNHGDNGNLCFVATHWTASAVLAVSTVVSFVHLHRWSLQLQVALRKKRAHLPEDAPCSLVGNASLALNLLCGDTTTGRTHQEDCIEPSLEWSSSFLKYGSRKRINLCAAMIAAKGGTALDAIVLALDAALRALGDASRPSLFHYVIEAGIIIRKLAIKVPNGIAEFFRNTLFDSHNAGSLTGGVRVVKG
jgi:hypothetical protein